MITTNKLFFPPCPKLASATIIRSFIKPNRSYLTGSQIFHVSSLYRDTRSTRLRYNLYSAVGSVQLLLQLYYSRSSQSSSLDVTRVTEVAPAFDDIIFDGEKESRRRRFRELTRVSRCGRRKWTQTVVSSLNGRRFKNIRSSLRAAAARLWTFAGWILFVLKAFCQLSVSILSRSKCLAFRRTGPSAFDANSLATQFHTIFPCSTSFALVCQLTRVSRRAIRGYNGVGSDSVREKKRVDELCLSSLRIHQVYSNLVDCNERSAMRKNKRKEFLHKKFHSTFLRT